MPAFIPKFVDLVRVTTSTQGTGPIVAGPATQGFANFAESLAVGDQFYYCVQGVDKPAEREVGRGVLLANGTIGRQAINGTLTNFTLGTKTLSLVAGAEWFRQQQQASETLAALESSQVASRSALAAVSKAVSGSTRYLTEPGREGSFCFEVGNFSARITVDTAQGIFIAPAAASTGASGAWVRQFDGAIKPEWFGAVADGVADDKPSSQAAIDYCVSVGGGVVRFRAKTYRMASQLLWSGAPIELIGEGSNIQPGVGTILKFPTGLTGAINMKNGTLGLGSNSSIRNLRIVGSAVTKAATISLATPGVVTSTAHGLAANAPIVFLTTGILPTGAVAGTTYFVRNPTINAFEFSATSGGASIATSGSQSGTHLVGVTVTDALADTGVGCGLLLQANRWRVDGVSVEQFEGNGTMVLSAVGLSVVAINANNGLSLHLQSYNNLKSGLKTLGGDSNGCTFIKSDCSSNAAHGVYEDAPGGNLHSNPHFAGNGADTPILIGVSSGRCRFNEVYKEVHSSSTLLFRTLTAGAGDNAVDIMMAEGSSALPSTLTADDQVGNTKWSDRGVTRFAKFGGDLGEGTVNVTVGGDLLIRIGKTIQFQDNPLTANWFVKNVSARMGFENGGVMLFDVGTAGDAKATSYKVGANQVVGVRGAAVADPAAITSVAGTVAVAAPTKAEFDALVAEFNKDRTDLAAVRTVQVAILARLRATTGHGLIA